MTTKSAAQRRLSEITNELNAIAKGRSTTPGRLDKLIAEHEELETVIKTHNAAAKYAGSADMFPTGQRSTFDSGQRLSFKGIGEPLARKMLTGDGLGAKTLAPSGLAVVEQTFQADPIALGKVATGLLDILPVQPHPTASFAYLRQTTRTNNAAVVDEGALKPTSVYSVTRVEDSLAVVAHLSEGVPRYWVLDNGSLQGFISNELAYGLSLALESKVFSDIAAVSGKQTQAFSTSVLATLRKSLTKLETAGWEPAALVLNPLDWESVELALATTNAVEYSGLPYDPATRRLFGVPVVLSNSATAGTAHALANEAVMLGTDSHGISLQWSETSNADDFAHNLIRARCEGRFATMVYRPGGIVVASLTVGGS